MADHPSDQQVAQAIKLGVAATQRGDHENALKLFKAVYANPAIKAPVDGLSHYGLSLTIAENQSSKGAQLCRDAIGTQFFDERHYENLVRIHLHKKNRTSAVAALEEGLKNIPTGSRLLALQKEMGLQPATTKTSRRGGSKLDLKSIPPVVALLAGALFFAVIFGLTFFIAYRQVYGP